MPDRLAAKRSRIGWPAPARTSDRGSPGHDGPVDEVVTETTCSSPRGDFGADGNPPTGRVRDEEGKRCSGQPGFELR